MAYSFNLPSLSTDPIKLVYFFFVACVILRIILNFVFLNTRACANTETVTKVSWKEAK